MSMIEEKTGVQSLVEGVNLLKEMQDHCGVKKPIINSELWHACAGPLVTIPQIGSLVYYFPQGHSEQVAATTNRSATMQVPNYPNLPSQLLCQVLNTTLHVDKDTDEIHSQMSLQPLNSEKDVFPISDIEMKPSRHPYAYFCKNLTPSDTSTHGGFSVPRRAAEKLFPQLDFSMQPPTQELIVPDLHGHTWKFRHIYRGQPKRHLLTTGWSSFVGAKRLKAGDAILFIRDEKSQLLLGIRRANRQQTGSPSSVLSADSMHIGVLAAAAHAAANRSPFTIFYNPRACPSEFVIPLIKYRKSVSGIHLSTGMRFGMMFETEESGKRRYMGTITGISDVDPIRWPGSKWHNLEVQWDDPGCGDKQNRVSPWDIETPESLFSFPSLSNLKRPFSTIFTTEPTQWGNVGTRPFVNCTIPSISNQWSEQLVNMLTKTQTVNSIFPISPITQKTEHSPPEPTLNEVPILNELSTVEQLDPSLCGLFPIPGHETWGPHEDVYSCINFEVSNGGGSVVNPSASSVMLNEFKDSDSCNPCDNLVNKCSLTRDVQSQLTSSSNEELTDTGIVKNGSWKQVAPPLRVRTYTKIQKAGSVGRSIDVLSFKNYDELCSEIERMFGLEGLLNDSLGSGWKLVYVDYENDVLLVGDDPWEEFIGCVRCIRILSPCEVRQMGEEGMQLLNNSAAALEALIT
ncbi:auxin response factor 5-like [Rutidosis leptorrhynchoides]|uniref:auxin response factor 5-like n=1 Tax=Rutidosis leptorrhynchoides TaxID=125765 RepID=UPI003A993AB7